MNRNTIDFLLRAKRAAYAGNGRETEPSRPHSHDLQYREGVLQYIDSYLGGEKFAGEEALWREEVPFWAMNYVGRVLSADFSGDFLKEVLSKGSAEHPYRGPLRYEKGDYSYTCSVKGDVRWFFGFEEICFKNNKVYECAFHGGEIM